MSRRARVIAAGYPHHSVHRGHNRQDIFRDEYDLGMFQELLIHYLNINECELMAYCFMRNHVHLLLLPGSREALIEMMHGISFRYAQYFNQSSDRKGSLWESRYFSSIVTEDLYLWRVAKYVCLNPVRAGITDDPCNYQWSSARDLMLGHPGLIPVQNWIEGTQREDFREMVLSNAEESEINFVLNRCRPYVSISGLIKLENTIGNWLIPRSQGRPRKSISNPH